MQCISLLQLLLDLGLDRDVLFQLKWLPLALPCTCKQHHVVSADPGFTNWDWPILSRGICKGDITATLCAKQMQLFAEEDPEA